MKDILIESWTYYDSPNQRVIIRFTFNNEDALKFIFNFKAGRKDYFYGSLRDYLPLSSEEEKIYIEERRAAAIKRLKSISVK